MHARRGGSHSARISAYAALMARSRALLGPECIAFSEMGCHVEEAAPDLSGAIECFQVLRALLFAELRGDLLPRERDRINPDIVWNIEKGQKLTAEEIIRARQARHALFHRVAGFFDTYDLLACPTVAVPPFAVEQRFPTQIGDEKLTTYID
jgi:amidase